MPSKPEAVRELDAAWGELMAAIDAVPSEAANEPGVVDNWSLKDLLGHMAFWSGRACETLRCVKDGRPQDVPRGEGEGWVDQWNEREFEARRDHPFTQVRAELLRNHEAAAQALDDLPDEKLNWKLGDSPVADYFAGDTYGHYREHIEQIREWQRQLDTSEA